MINDKKLKNNNNKNTPMSVLEELPLLAETFVDFIWDLLSIFLDVERRETKTGIYIFITFPIALWIVADLLNVSYIKFFHFRSLICIKYVYNYFYEKKKKKKKTDYTLSLAYSHPLMNASFREAMRIKKVIFFILNI